MGRVTIEENNYLVSLSRYYNQDSLKQAMQDIAAIFNDAFAEVNAILTSRYFSTPAPALFHVPVPVPPSTRVTTRASSPSLDPFHHPVLQPAPATSPHIEEERRKILNTLAILCRDLTAAIEGVQMLMLTYSQDIAMTTALDRLIEKVILCISDIRKKIPEEVLAEFCPEPPKQELSTSL